MGYVHRTIPVKIIVYIFCYTQVSINIIYFLPVSYWYLNKKWAFLLANLTISFFFYVFGETDNISVYFIQFSYICFYLLWTELFFIDEIPAPLSQFKCLFNCSWISNSMCLYIILEVFKACIFNSTQNISHYHYLHKYV